MPENPSGPGWEKYRKSEEAHHRKYGKGSGKYYKWNGQRWRLDNKGNGNYSPKSVDRKNTENNRTTSKRSERLKKQTSFSADPAAAETKRAKINSAGKHNHHKVPSNRAEALADKYGGKIPEEVHKAHNKQGVYFGDDPRNYLGLSQSKHKAAHAAYNALDDAIASADGGKYVFEQLKRSLGFSKGKNVMAGASNFSASLLGFAPELMEIADNYTNGKASEVVNGAINGVVQGAIDGYKNAAENYTNGDNFDTM